MQGTQFPQGRGALQGELALVAMEPVELARDGFIEERVARTGNGGDGFNDLREVPGGAEEDFKSRALREALRIEFSKPLRFELCVWCVHARSVARRVVKAARFRAARRG